MNRHSSLLVHLVCIRFFQALHRALSAEVEEGVGGSDSHELLEVGRKSPTLSNGKGILSQSKGVVYELGSSRP